MKRILTLMMAVVFIHGGGWIGNDKYADKGYMPNTIAAMLDNGIVVASDALLKLLLQNSHCGFCRV